MKLKALLIANLIMTSLCCALTLYDVAVEVEVYSEK